MKKKTRKPMTVEEETAKPRRGRPKKSEAEKASDPRRILLSEIKSDLKRVKKSKKRLALLLDKARAEQSLLMAALMDSLEKIKTELKKKPKKAKKAKTGKRGRPGRKPGKKLGRKPVRKPGRKPGRPKGNKEAKLPVKTGKKRGRPRKIVEAVKTESEKKPQPARAQAPISDKLVTPIPKPGRKIFKKKAAKSSAKPIQKEVSPDAAPAITPDEEPKTE
ncbi:MAG: hypothetical protein NTZ26_03470 [Candidatus Aminicenantes bacterium]|nr:hypothetical protein [Candidatus Aminicenantes bacterium]